MADPTPRDRMRKRLENALTLWRDGRLTPPYRAPFAVVMQDSLVQLRSYANPHGSSIAGARPILLVPPLMVTSEIYDISPELSAVAFLAAHGAPTYVADFGAPEAQEGGLDRTLDDHVLAVSRCIDHLRAATGEDVHLVGYSQGGMFCYQTAAFRKSAGIASVVTFGSPVDLRRNVPFELNDKIAERVIAVTRRLIDRPLEGLRGLPGTLSARGFKLLAPVQELRHLVQLFGVLHDDEAMRRLEPKRRFLGGEGFIAWPGPALRAFIDQFVVQNRMKAGGFVIAGRTVALADITSPICYVVGEDDDLALPDAVRAIAAAAPRAATYPVHVRAGHFGLVVGRAAMSACWPTVLAWSAWHDGRGPRPDILDRAAEHSAPDDSADSPDARDTPLERLRELAAGAADLAWDRLGAWGVALGRRTDRWRWQVPRAVRRALLERGSPLARDTTLADTLRARAASDPDAIAFLYAGRAFTLREADARIDAAAAELRAAGVTRGDHVPIADEAGPDAIARLLALTRLAAIPVSTPGVRPPHFSLYDRIPCGPAAESGDPRSAARDRAADLALVVPAGPITHRAWLVAGLDLAIATRLTPADTLYCPVALPTASFAVVLAAALLGGARLQISDRAPDPDRRPIWDELLNTGATVVIADDDIAHELADAPRPDRHPVRFVLGDALGSELAATLSERLGTRTRYRTLTPLGA